MNKASRKKNDPRDYCRNCSHPDWIHVKTYYYACGREPRDAEWLTDNQICPCKEFVPEDNLEYLEWCFKKKEQL